MSRVKLSKRYCDTATYEGRAGSLDVRWDEATRGFGLRLYPSGRKSWVIFYRTPEGRQRLHALAPYEHLTLEQARDEGRGQLGRVAKDQADPAGERRASRLGETVEELVDLYVKEWAKPRKKTWQEDERQLRRDVVPVWGARRMADVTRGEVRELLAAKAKTSPVAANRLLAVLRTLFGFAVDREMLEHSPCERLQPPAKESRRERVLTAEEIQALWGATRDAGSGRALRFILATAQRPGEVVGLRWQEIEGAWWTIPQERAKPGRAHRVPLSPLARAILGKETGRSGYGWPAPGKARHLTLWTLDHDTSELRKAHPLAHFTPHDLRRTAATHMAGLGIPRLVISRLLGHAEGGVTSIYDRHSYDAEKREALEAWGTALKRLCEPDTSEAVKTSEAVLG